MNKNRNFGKMVDGVLVYAPVSIVSDGRVICNPQEVVYVDNGWKKVVETKPALSANEHFKFDRYNETEDTIEVVYVAEANPPKVRILSKLKFVALMTQLGHWDTVKQFIETNGLMDLYLAAQNFREDNEYFIQGKAQFAEALGVSAEQVEEWVSQCVADFDGYRY